jgi:Fe-S cluster biogenesis protein NfuA
VIVMADSEKTPVNLELLEATLNIIRQSLQADGGDVVLVSCDEDGVSELIERLIGERGAK